MSRILERANALDWERVKEQGHVSEGKQQPRHEWVAKALKPQLTEGEWAAACRAVKECAPAFDGMRRAFDDAPVDCSSSDYGMAAKVAAARRLEGLRQAAFIRTGASKAPACVEWIAQMWTLPEIAHAMGHYRRTGPRHIGRITVDTRTTRPFVRLVLLGMAAYFDECETERAMWSGRAA